MRVFEVPEPVGPWVTVLVLPAAQQVHCRPARAHRRRRRRGLRGRRSGRSRCSSRASSLARITVSVRRPDRRDDGRCRTPSSAVIDDLSTSWEDRLREALVAEVGEAQGRDAVRAHRRARAAGVLGPPCSRVGPPAMSVASPRCSTAATRWRPPSVTTSTRRTVSGASASTAEVSRRRCPNCCRCSTTWASRRWTSSPTRSAPATSGCSSTTSACASRRGSSWTSQRWSDLQRAFTALVLGDVEGDGFNRLVLAAGLTAREVAVVRAYGKYLRQIGFSFSQPYIEATLQSHPRVVADLIALFHARFDPARPGGDDARPDAWPRSGDACRAPPSMPSPASTTTASAGCS